MNKKGFTLIELLAVIVILAIIALIATPIVLNIIEDSRKSAVETSARNIVSAAETYYMSKTMNGSAIGNIDLSTDTLKYNGEQADKGAITFYDGKAQGTIYINGYCVKIDSSNNVTSEKMEEDDCEIEITQSNMLGCDSVYWDLNTNEREVVDMNALVPDSFCILISDTVVTEQDISNGYSITYSADGYEETVDFNGDYFGSIKTDLQIGDGLFYSIPEDNYELDGGIVFPKKGLYALIHQDAIGFNGYIIKLTISNYTGFYHTEYCTH